MLASRSKSHQKVEESSKSPKNLKGLKSCKGHWFGGIFTEAPILCQRTRTFKRVLTVFRAFFARPKSFVNTTLALIVDKAKLIELLIRCSHQAFICAAHAFPLLLQFWDVLRVLAIKTTWELVIYVLFEIFQFWRCILKENVLAQDWWARKILKERTYRLERHESRLGRDYLCLLIGQSWLARKRATIWSFSLSSYTIC